MDRNGWKCGILKSNTEFYSCWAGLRNAREVAWLGDSATKLPCAADKAPTRSHHMHSEYFSFQLFNSIWIPNYLSQPVIYIVVYHDQKIWPKKIRPNNLPAETKSNSIIILCLMIFIIVKEIWQISQNILVPSLSSKLT